MMPPLLHIRISLENMVYGVGGDPNKCAIADYVYNKWPHLTSARIGQSTIRISDKNARLRYIWSTPRSVSKWIKQFDAWKAGKGPAPGQWLEFYLRRDEAETEPMKPEPTPEVRQEQREQIAAWRQRLDAMTPAEKAERQKRLATRRANRRRG